MIGSKTQAQTQYITNKTNYKLLTGVACINNCGRSKNGQFSTCCQACSGVAGPHTGNCDSSHALCSKGCGRYANSGLNFTTCCNSCTGPNSNHTQVCNLRHPSNTNVNNTNVYINTNQLYYQPSKQNQQVPQKHINETVVLVNNNVSNRKSVDVDSNSSLAQILTKIQNKLATIPGYNPPYGGKFHVELVDNANDVQGKTNNFNLINGISMDLCKKSVWDCVGKGNVSGGFSLVIASGNQYHQSPLHITIGFFSNCRNVMNDLYDAVEQGLNVKLH